MKYAPHLCGRIIGAAHQDVKSKTPGATTPAFYQSVVIRVELVERFEFGAHSLDCELRVINTVSNVYFAYPETTFGSSAKSVGIKRACPGVL